MNPWIISIIGMLPAIWACGPTADSHKTRASATSIQEKNPIYQPGLKKTLENLQPEIQEGGKSEMEALGLLKLYSHVLGVIHSESMEKQFALENSLWLRPSAQLLRLAVNSPDPNVQEVFFFSLKKRIQRVSDKRQLPSLMRSVDRARSEIISAEPGNLLLLGFLDNIYNKCTQILREARTDNGPERVLQAAQKKARTMVRRMEAFQESADIEFRSLESQRFELREMIANYVGPENTALLEKIRSDLQRVETLGMEHIKKRIDIATHLIDAQKALGMISPFEADELRRELWTKIRSLTDADLSRFRHMVQIKQQQVGRH